MGWFQKEHLTTRSKISFMKSSTQQWLRRIWNHFYYKHLNFDEADFLYFKLLTWFIFFSQNNGILTIILPSFLLLKIKIRNHWNIKNIKSLHSEFSSTLKQRSRFQQPKKDVLIFISQTQNTTTRVTPPYKKIFWKSK